MPHQLEEHDTMFSANGIVPWHGLGTILEGDVQFGDVLHVAGLDWEVELAPVFAGIPTRMPDGPTTTRYEPIADRQAVVRVDTQRVIDIVGNDYQPLQNRLGLDLLHHLMDTDDVSVETAGSLRNNRIVWVCARLNRDGAPATITIGGDAHVPYIIFSSSHDGSMAASVTCGPVRVVCANTLTASITRAQATWRTRHSGDVTGRVAEAREALQMGWTYYDEFTKSVEALMAHELTTDAAYGVLHRLLPLPDESDKPTAFRNQQARHDTIWMRYDAVAERHGRTAWSLLNAVNEWELWDRPARSQRTRLERNAMAVLRDRQPYTQRANAILAVG